MASAPRQRVVESIRRQDRQRRASDFITHCAEVLDRGPTPDEAAAAAAHCHGDLAIVQPVLDLKVSS